MGIDREDVENCVQKGGQSERDIKSPNVEVLSLNAQADDSDHHAESECKVQDLKLILNWLYAYREEKKRQQAEAALRRQADEHQNDSQDRDGREDPHNRRRFGDQHVATRL